MLQYSASGQLTACVPTVGVKLGVVLPGAREGKVQIGR